MGPAGWTPLATKGVELVEVALVDRPVVEVGKPQARQWAMCGRIGTRGRFLHPETRFCAESVAGAEMCSAQNGGAGGQVATMRRPSAVAVTMVPSASTVAPVRQGPSVSP